METDKIMVSGTATNRFYQLIHKTSIQLVNANAGEIDNAVDDCLAKIGEYFHVDQVGLGQWSKAGKILPTLRAWGPKPVGDYLKTDGPGPEAYAAFCRKGFLVWNCLEDLEELPRLQKHLRQVGALAGVFCLNRNFGTHTQHLVMAKVKPQIWPEDTVECLAAFGEVMFSAIERRRVEIEAEKLRNMEILTSSIAAQLTNLHLDSMDAEIDKALGKIGETTGADISIFYRWTDQNQSTLTSREWNADSIAGTCFFGPDPDDSYPWLISQLKGAKPLLFSNLSNLSSVAEAEFEILKRFGIQSMVWAPFDTANGTTGHMGLGTVNRESPWAEGIVPILSVVGNIFANAIDRQRTDMELTQAYNEIKNLKDILAAENETLRLEVKDLRSDDKLVGNSPLFRTTLFQAKQVAKTDSTVLLLGETGTGKGLIARNIHEQSRRAQHPLVIVNCAALPSALIESELFGHEKGAFTGAISRKIGRFELADGGTIFLDEIGDLPIELQTKLLRILQDGEFERVGSVITKTVDVRVISATNRDLGMLIEQGTFRSDLYYRLGVFPIKLPALRERRDDIPLLIWFFVSELQHQLGKTFTDISARVMNTLTSYEWPGNIRELRNIIERSMILSQGSSLELYDLLLGNLEMRNASSQQLKRKGGTMQEVERAHIEKVLEECDWKIRGKGGAAENLGLKRTTLQSRMKKLGIERPTN
jgi:transcriptional regulator with GAF, ATPase, and Fis domain